MAVYQKERGGRGEKRGERGEERLFFDICRYSNNIEIVKFFHECGCPFAQDGSSGNHLSPLLPSPLTIYLSSYDLSFNSSSSPFAAEGVRSVEMLQLLHEWGVPFKETLMSTAIYEENILPLRHLLLPSSFFLFLFLFSLSLSLSLPLPLSFTPPRY